jgi:hypothetical protein
MVRSQLLPIGGAPSRREADLQDVLRLLTAALAAACLLPLATAHAAESGVVLGGSQFDDARSLDAIHRSGVDWIRVYAYRNELEPRPGVLDTRLVKAYADSVRRHLWEGVRTEIVLVGTPAWESGSSDPLAAPDPAGFARFAQRFAQAVPDVGAWEVWQEADAEKWWPAGPNPAAYTALLQATYPALHAVSGAPVILGGLTGNDYPFLEALYAAGAKGSFDAVSVHTDTACGIASPYSYYRDPDGRVSRWSFLGYQEVLQSMAAAGDGDKKLWMTEMGWSSSSALCDQGVWAGQKPGGVSEDAQALFLRQAWHCVASDPRVAGAFWFNLVDLGADDAPDHRFGLLRSDGSEKPAFAALTDVAAGNDRLTDACGDFTGPAIQVLRLGDQGKSGRYARFLRVKVAAADPQTVARITLFLNGRKVGVFGTQGPIMVGDRMLPQAAGLKNGRNTLTIQARDANGNDTAQDFAITKVAPGQAKARKRAKARARAKLRHRR